jgi:hypothetical protein
MLFLIFGQGAAAFQQENPMTNCKHKRRLSKTGFGWCLDCGALWESGRAHVPAMMVEPPLSAGIQLKVSIEVLMDRFGETGVMRAVADEMDRRLSRALREEANLRRKLNLREAAE